MSGRAYQPPIDAVLAPPLARRFGSLWWAGIAAAAAGILLLGWALSGPALRGIGVWGTNVPYVWGFDLTSYGWWIGIANGAALFAAILVLTRNSLRTAINRFAIGLAVGAAICAAVFPVFHLGKPWLAYWTIPYPTAMELWPQFRSPITWDFWNILIYLTVLALLWYVGLIPDLATLRDRANRRGRRIAYGLFALGWRGSAVQWQFHQRAHRIVALTLIPLLFVAQTIVAFETVSTLVPAWHEGWQTLHYILSGLLSGIAMVLLVALLLRARLGLGEHIDDADASLLALLVLAGSLLLAAVYAAGWLYALGGEETVRRAAATRMFGPYGALYWAGFALAILPPQLFWRKANRLRAGLGAAVAAAVLAGVYLDHLSLIVGGIQLGHLMRAAPAYAPTVSEASLLAGTLGLFLLMVLVSVRRLPIVSLYETRFDVREQLR